MRKENQASVWNGTESVDLIMTFRTQNLLDLYKNEMQGQISDGMWENSRNTDWLWRGKILYLLGDTTSVICCSGYKLDRGKKNFYMGKELCDIVGERAMEEAGFSSIKEMRAGWTEIANAIHNARPFSMDEYREYYTEPEKKKRQVLDNNKELLITKLKEELGDSLKEVTSTYFDYTGDNYITLEVLPELNKIRVKSYSGLDMSKAVPVEKVKSFIQFLIETREKYLTFSN